MHWPDVNEFVLNTGLPEQSSVLYSWKITVLPLHEKPSEAFELARQYVGGTIKDSCNISQPASKKVWIAIQSANGTCGTDELHPTW